MPGGPAPISSGRMISLFPAPVRVGQYWVPIPLLGVGLGWMVLHRKVNMAPPAFPGGSTQIASSVTMRYTSTLECTFHYWTLLRHSPCSPSLLPPEKWSQISFRDLVECPGRGLSAPWLGPAFWLTRWDGMKSI